MPSKHESVFSFFCTGVRPFNSILGIGFHQSNPITARPALSALGAFAPVLAALILTYKHDHLSGVLQLLQRSFDFKRIKNETWYLAFVLINPAIAVLAYGLMRAIGESLPLLLSKNI